MKSIKFRNIRVGFQKLNNSVFLHKYDFDTNISKTWVIQVGNYIKDPILEYKNNYKLWNFFLVRVGFNMEEVK